MFNKEKLWAIDLTFFLLIFFTIVNLFLNFSGADFIFLIVLGLYYIKIKLLRIKKYH